MCENLEVQCCSWVSFRVCQCHKVGRVFCVQLMMMNCKKFIYRLIILFVKQCSLYIIENSQCQCDSHRSRTENPANLSRERHGFSNTMFKRFFIIHLAYSVVG